VIADIVLDPNGGFQVRDVTGFSVTFSSRLTTQGLSCDQWTQGDGFGGASLWRTDQETGNDATILIEQNCNSNINVLCCAPTYYKKRKSNY
jgi:hypothetical protein